MKISLSHSHRAKALVRADPLVPAQIYIRVDGQYDLLKVQTHQRVDKKCNPRRGGFRDNFPQPGDTEI